MSRVFTMPEVIIKLTPEVRIFVDGGDVTDEWEARSKVVLARCGKACGVLWRNFAWGLRQGAPATNGAATLQVRISNLEHQNDGLRENNRALLKANATLTDALAKLANPVITNISNNVVGIEPVESAVRIDDPGPTRFDFHDFEDPPVET